MSIIHQKDNDDYNNNESDGIKMKKVRCTKPQLVMYSGLAKYKQFISE